MNLLLLEEPDFQPDGTVHLTGRRLRHAREVLGASVGAVLRVGRLGGEVGTGEVLSVEEGSLRLAVRLQDPPPARPGIDLLLAIPRPKALKKILPAAASLGVDRIVLVNAARVERSYFDSHLLAPASIAELLRLGAEQARDTVLPEVRLERRLRPFVEDVSPDLFGSARRLLAHPGAGVGLFDLQRPSGADRLVLAIGPDGGWVPFEVGLLQASGFLPFCAGERPLRVEVAVSVLLGQLLLWKPPAAPASVPPADREP